MPRLAVRVCIGCALVAPLAACTGDLVDLDAADAALMNAPTFVAAIQKDLDANGCTAGGACHGGGGAPMMLAANVKDLPSLTRNWQEVKPRASSGEASLLLAKTLQTSGTMHTGTRPFATTSDPTYQRWLAWIRAGAPLGAPLPDGGSAQRDMTPSDTDGSTD